MLNQITGEDAAAVLAVLLVLAGAAWGWHHGRAEGGDGGLGELWRPSSRRARLVLAVVALAAVGGIAMWGYLVYGRLYGLLLVGVPVMQLFYLWRPPLDEHEALKERARHFSRASTGALLLVLLGPALLGGPFRVPLVLGPAAAVVGFGSGWVRSRSLARASIRGTAADG